MSALPTWNNLAHAVTAVRSRWVPNTVVVITQSTCVGGAVLSSVAPFNRHPSCIVETEDRVLRGISIYASWIGLCSSISSSIIEVYIAIKYSISTSISTRDAANPFWRTFEESFTSWIYGKRITSIDDLTKFITAYKPICISFWSAKPLWTTTHRTSWVEPIIVNILWTITSN
jgi:hypothetical protein